MQTVQIVIIVLLSKLPGKALKLDFKQRIAVDKFLFVAL